jgi:hypothetical protein
MFEVEISAMSPARFASVLRPDRLAVFEQGIREGRELLEGRVVWNVIRRVLKQTDVRAAA